MCVGKFNRKKFYKQIYYQYEACVCPSTKYSESEKPECCGAEGLIDWNKEAAIKVKCELKQQNQSAQVKTAFAWKVIFY